MKFTKKECIEAVISEPLEFGQWNEHSNNKCNVCAVGAILRQTQGINGDREINNTMMRNSRGSCYKEMAIKNHLKNGNYLHALSCYFESLEQEVPHNTSPNTKVRLALVSFIEAEFPNRFEYVD